MIIRDRGTLFQCLYPIHIHIFLNIYNLFLHSIHPFILTTQKRNILTKIFKCRKASHYHSRYWDRVQRIGASQTIWSKAQVIHQSVNHNCSYIWLLITYLTIHITPVIYLYIKLCIYSFLLSNHSLSFHQQ